MIGIVLPLNSISYMIIDEVITFPMSYFVSMPRLSVIFHMNICITTRIVVNIVNSIEKLTFTVSRALSMMNTNSTVWLKNHKNYMKAIQIKLRTW